MLLQSPVTLPSWELHRQVHRVLEKKKLDFFGKKIELLKLLILNVSKSFVFFWTIFGLIPVRLASLGLFLCWLFFFSFASASPFLGCSTAVPFQLASAERCEFSCWMSLAWCKHIARDMLKSSRWIEPGRDNSKTVRRSMLKIRARVFNLEHRGKSESWLTHLQLEKDSFYACHVTHLLSFNC